MTTPALQRGSKKVAGIASWWERQKAEQARAEIEFGHIAAPADAKQLLPPEKDDKGNWIRAFEGTSRKVGRTEVRILGRQLANGSVTRFITIDSGTDLDAKTTRKVAAAAVEAADEVDSTAANSR
jgi:hypothetical protein